ncbi:MAG: esterase-like activity of phytase family protein [Alteraurantiacibacter sp.]
MHKRKLVAGVILGLMLAPGTLLRTHVSVDANGDLSTVRLTDVPETRSSGGFTREEVWHLSSPHLGFGGYSALLVLGETTLRAFSDRGRLLTFAIPGQAEQRQPRFATVWDRGDLSQTVNDVEAATRDPNSGDYWLAFENSNAVIRYSIASKYIRSRRPPAWQGWSKNSGAEAMARLPDGRFIILPERSSTGLLYPSDPTGDVEPLEFASAIPGDFHPTDMAALPDGRVLVLLRQLDWTLPPFSSAIGIADPRGLEEGATLDIELLVRLDTILPRENYEALALAGVNNDGTVRLWLMSDDNLASFQRTLLAQLSWREEGANSAHEKAREE